MPDAATIGVLRDVTSLVLIALGLGTFAYRIVRQRYRHIAWNAGGKVVSRPYRLPDALLAFLLLSPYVLGLLFADTSTTPTSTSAAHANPELGSMLYQIILVLGEGLVLVLFLKRARGLDPADLFGIHNLPLGKVIAFTLGAIAPTFLIVMVANMGANEVLKGVWPDASPQEIVKAFEATGSIPVRVLMIFAAVVAAPLTEELLFRGLFYGVCKRYTDSWFAALVTSLVFATVHLHVGSFVPLFALAVVLVGVYELTGCLLVPMLIHALFNSMMLISMMLGGH